MATLGNLVWFIFGGAVTALVWLLAGVVMACTVIGLPFAYAAFRMAGFSACPFGRELVDARDLGHKRVAGTAAANVLWFLLFGWILALAHAVSAVASIVSCIAILPILLGAPAWAVAHIRLANVTLAPLGKRIVSKGEAQAILNAKHAARFARQ